MDAASATAAGRLRQAARLCWRAPSHAGRMGATSMFTLVYTSDGDTRRHELRAGDTVVGRAPVCDLAIDDPSISRRHARFRSHGEHCVVTDLGGRNGTFVDGELVSEAVLSDGTEVVLGRFTLRVEHTPPALLILSDHQSLFASPQTLLRRVDDETETGTGVEPAARSERVLLLLSEISRQLVPMQAWPDILERIVTVVFATIAAERAFLVLLDDQTGEPVPRVVRRSDGAALTDATLSRTVVHKVIDDRVAVLACGPALDAPPASAGRVQKRDVRSFMCVPLWDRTDVLGVLYVDNPDTAVLTPADLDILQALSSYAAAAITEARRLSQTAGNDAAQNE